MNRKSILLFTGPIVLLALACNATFTVGNPTPTAEPPTQIPTATSAPLSAQVTLVSQPYSESNQDPVFTITAQTPQLSGSDDPRVLAFNRRLDDLVQNEVDIFRKNFIETPVVDVAAGSFLEVTYVLAAQYDDIWSFKFVFFFYTNGAAHPGHYSMTVNYDLDQGRELTLGDLFASGSNYLETISAYCIAELSKQPFFDGAFTTGADPTPENYRNWNISENGLLITFDEYQVAPYAAGAQEVLVPYERLSALIDPQGPLRSLIR